MNKTTAAIALGGVVCLFALAIQLRNVTAVAAAHARSAAGTATNGPSSWVPFTADYEKSHHGTVEVRGRIFRDSNGSLRYEITAGSAELVSATEGRRVITINNRVERMIFVRGRSGGWARLPMPDNMATHGPQTRLTMLGVSSSPETELFENMPVYRYAAPDGSVQLLAPALNFLAVQVQAPDGSVQKYFHIRRAEPAADLFVPPSAASVRLAESMPDLMR